jgi:hypothetical protein
MIDTVQKIEFEDKVNIIKNVTTDKVITFNHSCTCKSDNKEEIPWRRLNWRSQLLS